MKFATTYLRNRAMLKDHLDNMMAEDVMDKYNVSKAMVSNGIRQALETIKEHTDYEGTTSTDITLLRKDKADILHYMTQRIPTTSLTPDAKKMLREEFGDGYSLTPNIVAERWSETGFARNRYHYYRHLESIRTWLASEGYFVDDFLDQEMINTGFAHMFEGLKGLPQNEGVKIEVTDTSLDRRIAYINATISSDKQVAKRRLKLELLPAY